MDPPWRDSTRRGELRRSVTVLEFPRRFVCRTRVAGGGACGYVFEADPETRRVACPRCGHVADLPRPSGRKRRRPERPAVRCEHPSERRYVDQAGRQRCATCGGELQR